MCFIFETEPAASLPLSPCLTLHGSTRKETLHLGTLIHFLSNTHLFPHTMQLPTPYWPTGISWDPRIEDGASLPWFKIQSKAACVFYMDSTSLQVALRCHPSASTVRGCLAPLGACHVLSSSAPGHTPRSSAEPARGGPTPHLPALRSQEGGRVRRGEGRAPPGGLCRI